MVVEKSFHLPMLVKFAQRGPSAPAGCATRPQRLHFTNDTVLPPVLLVNALRDFATGYAVAVSMHEQLPGSVLLTRNGTGHTS